MTDQLPENKPRRPCETGGENRARQRRAAPETWWDLADGDDAQRERRWLDFDGRRAAESAGRDTRPPQLVRVNQPPHQPYNSEGLDDVASRVALCQPLTAAARDPDGAFLEELAMFLLNCWGADSQRLRQQLSAWLQECRPPWPDEVIHRALRRAAGRHEDEQAAERLMERLPAEPRPDGRVLVEGWWPAGLPLLFYGPMKSCKTHLGLHLATCLALRQPFLGMTTCPGWDRPPRVLVWSLESGRRHLEAALGRMVGSDGLQELKYDQDGVGVWSLSEGALLAMECRNLKPAMQELSDLTGMLRHFRVDVLILDPVYLLLPDRVNVSMASEVGGFLRKLDGAVREAGCTLALVGHTLKSTKPGQQLGVGMMSGAGFGEFARCWGLITRAKRFNPSRPGRHELRLALGNCEGFACSLRMTVEEFPNFRVSVLGGADGSGADDCEFEGDGDKAAPRVRKAVTLESGCPDGCSAARFREAIERVRAALTRLLAEAPGGEVARSAVADAVKASGGAMNNRLLTATLGALQATGEVDVFMEVLGNRKSYFVRAAAVRSESSSQAIP